jgi:hypothetical protein
MVATGAYVIRPLRIRETRGRRQIVHNPSMRFRSAVVALASAAVLMTPAALVMPASAWGAHSVGTSGQIAWVRSAATRFVTAELAGSGADACGILNAPLRATEHGRTCTQRWNAKLAKLLREPGGRAQLRAQKRAIGTAAVVVHGNVASIDLPTTLMGNANRFVWTENCWMLAG